MTHPLEFVQRMLMWLFWFLAYVGPGIALLIIGLFLVVYGLLFVGPDNGAFIASGLVALFAGIGQLWRALQKEHVTD